MSFSSRFLRTDVPSSQHSIIASFGLSIVAILILFAIAPIFPQSSTTSSPPSGTLLYHFLGHESNQVDSLAWSPDSSRIATVGTFDGTIHIWDALTGDHLLTYQTPSTQVNSLAWSPDGKYIAANVANHLYMLEVDPSLLRRVFVLASPMLNSVNSVVAWSPDGTRIALACSDHAIRVWNVTAGQLDTRQKPLIYTRHAKEVYALTWSPDGQYIASASIDNTIQIWSISAGNKTYRTIHSTSLESAELYSNIAWSPDGEQIASENGEGIVGVWSSDTGIEQFSVETNLPLGGAVAWSPDSQYLASGSSDNSFHTQILVFSKDGGQVVHGLYGETFTSSYMSGSPQSLEWSPNADYIAAADRGGHGVFVWQSRGTDASTLQSLFQGDDPSLGLLKAIGICYGIFIGGIVLYEVLSPKKKPSRSNPRVTKGAAILSVLGNLVLYLLAVLAT